MEGSVPELKLLFLQMLVILVAARLAGAAFRILGQPSVVGEMAAGLLLGPSLLGRVFPAAMNSLFSADRLGPLYALSQVGLVLFMFLMGLEVRPGAIRGSAGSVAVASQASILAPFVAGSILASIFIHASETAPLGCRLSCSSEPLWGSPRFPCSLASWPNAN
jgi:Kef-type K+ transport system membrane component KefB